MHLNCYQKFSYLKIDLTLLEDMKQMGPSSIDAEIRSLSEDMGGSTDLIEKFLNFILYLLSTKKNFELANSYLALLLKLHANKISFEDDLIRVLEQIKEMQTLAWDNLKINFNKNLCLVSYLKSVT
jgi:U3 small nucleolar RNA-associated protein 21